MNSIQGAVRILDEGYHFSYMFHRFSRPARANRGWRLNVGHAERDALQQPDEILHAPYVRLPAVLALTFFSSATRVRS